MTHARPFFCKRWRDGALALVCAWLVFVPASAWSVAPDKVRLQLKWYHQFQFAGYYAAQSKGFYNAQGLDVEILEGAGDRSPEKVVLHKQAEFGVHDGADLVFRRLGGEPVVALAAVFQHSPYVVISRKSSGILHPSDLVGRRVLITQDQGSAQILAMFRREGIKVNSTLDQTPVKFAAHTWNVLDVIESRADAMTAYLTEIPGFQRRYGFNPAVLNPLDFGIDFYGDTLFTSSDYLKSRPEVVERFRRASLQGWQYAMAHPEEIADVILTLASARPNKPDRQTLLDEAQAMVNIVLPTLVDIGNMNPGRWEKMAEIYRELGMVATSANLEGFSYEVDAEKRDIHKRIALLVMVLLGMSVLALGSFIWLRLLRSQVLSRTRELTNEVAERKRTEAALLESQQNLSITLNSIGDAVIATDTAGRITGMNPTAERLTAWPQTEALGQPLTEVFRIINAVTRLPAVNPVQRVMERGEVVGLANHTTLLARDGHEVQISDSAAPIRNADAQTVGVVLVFSDVSERYAAQAALEESRERYRALSAASSEAIFISEKGICLEQNSQAQEMFGYTLAEATGRMGVLWIAPDDRDRVLQHMMSGYEQPYEVLGLRKDGSTFPAVIRARMMHYQSRNVRVTSMRDITERKHAEKALLESEARFRTLIERSPEATLVHRLGTILYANPAAVHLFGAASAQQLLSKTTPELIHPDSRDAQAQRMKRIAEGASTLEMVELKFVRFDARAIEVQIQGASIVYDGAPATLVSMLDITGQKQAEEALRIAATAFESQQGMAITDAQRVILRVNKSFTSITGYSAEEAVGQTPRILSSGRHDSAFYAGMTQTLESSGAWQGEIWNRRKSGEIYPEWLTISTVKDDAGLTTHYVAIFNDVSERVSAQAQIETLAFYDPLTSLPNRRLLLDRLEQALHVGTRHTRKNALLFVDLDNFKTINDTLGHFQGDALLVQVAQRLRTCIREGDTVARLGGDEFVVMLEDLSEDNIEAATQAEVVADKILSAFVAAFALEGGAHHGTPSIGITLFGGEVLEGSEQPLKRAELAMFQAKAAGRNTLRFFDTLMQAEVSARASLEADLREAVQKQQFVLHYQPQVVGAGRVTGVEALVRWQHPQRGMVSPAEFIPLAEETGLILPMGQWVLEAACAQLAAWATDPVLAHLTMAVNVSARQLKQADFVESVLATLSRSGATPKQLKLELTESMLVDDVEPVIAKMGALKARGVSFSLDDFGTGYSSLAYLKRLPLDQLKIDQGFVRNIVSDPNDAAIAKMVVALAESMGLSVIAEGVELQAQADFLAHLGCHACQGYLFSRPLALEALETFVRRHF